MTPENLECGIRYKFAPVQRDLRPRRYPEMDRLIHWCRVFDAEGMAPLLGGASAGNLSFRTMGGYVITATRTLLKAEMSWTNLTEVVRSNWLDFEVHYLGASPPSSDSFLHERIYVERPDVNAVFHGHDDAVLSAADQLAREFDIALTADEMAFGTKPDADITAKELGAKHYIIRKGHGFLAACRTMDQAGDLSLHIHRRALELRPPTPSAAAPSE